MSPVSFAHEQEVQRTIAIIQKTHHVSILQIDVAEIREWIRRGKTPHQIAVQWWAQVPKES